MNQELFAKIAKVISDKPGEFDMSGWESTGSCGTTRCVAGWAVHFETGQPLYIKTPGSTVDIHPSARELARRLGVVADFECLGGELLGLGSTDASMLFYADNETARQAVDLFANGYMNEAFQVLEA